MSVQIVNKKNYYFYALKRLVSLKTLCGYVTENIKYYERYTAYNSSDILAAVVQSFI